VIFYNRDITSLTLCIVMVLFKQPRFKGCKYEPKIEALKECRDEIFFLKCRNNLKFRNLKLRKIMYFLYGVLAGL
jgi:AAA+ ATPase superfamily predicted ATPase